MDGRLKASLSQLRPEYRIVLLLWGVEGLKYREIAEIQNVPIGTVMSRLHRARSILTEQLAEFAEVFGYTGRSSGGETQAPTKGSARRRQVLLEIQWI